MISQHNYGCSYECAVFRPFARGLEAASSSQYVLRFLRRLQTGFPCFTFRSTEAIQVESFGQDLRGGIEKVARFLQKPLTDDQLTRLTEHLRFENLSKNKAVNSESYKEIGLMNTDGHFVRKGKTGDWKNHFGPELNRRIDEWIASNLAGTDLKFVTEIDKQD